MTVTVEEAPHATPTTPAPGEYSEVRHRGLAIEAKLAEWNLKYTYEPAVPIESIKVVSSTQVRAVEHRVDKQQEEQYAEQARNGAVFPPIVLMGNVLVDGSTRLGGFKMLKRTTIPAYVVNFPNSVLAVAFAGAMNQMNGRRLAPEEAHQAAMGLLGFGHTEESVARELGYSRSVITNWRNERTFDEKASRCGITPLIPKVTRSDKWKLAKVAHDPQFAAATQLVAEVRPKNAQVKELVEDIAKATTDADALLVVEAKRAEWQPSGPPPHRVAVPKEMAQARRVLPQLVNLVDNPLLLVESDPARRDTWIEMLRTIRAGLDQALAANGA